MMKNYWFTSDEHYLHFNIIKLCKRPFESLGHMHNVLIDNHNSVVKDEDDVYHLGDFSYKGRVEDVIEILNELKGKHFFLFGNHDSALRHIVGNNSFKKWKFSDKFNFYGSCDPNETVIRTIYLQNKRIVLSHYALRTWQGAFRGSYHLFGHSHSNLPTLHRSMDVGVDGNNFFPYNLNEIIEKMEKVTEEFSEINQ